MARNQQQIRHPENVGSWEADGWVTTGLTYHACSVAQLCLCNSMVCSPPGSSVHEILQARIPEWVPITFFGGSSPPRDRTCISCIEHGFFTTEPPGKPYCVCIYIYIFFFSPPHSLISLFNTDNTT